MAKKEIIWSRRAKEEFQDILDFYIHRNKSTVYSLKLLEETEALLMTLKDNIYLGRLSANKKTRVIVKENYLIFYEIKENWIEIVSFWDNRQDPGKRFDR